MVMIYTRMQKLEVNGQSVPKIDGQTDGQTDGRTEAIALPPTLMRSVNIGLIGLHNCQFIWVSAVSVRTADIGSVWH